MVSVSATGITLSFEEVSESGGSPLLRYVLFARAQSSPSSVEVATYLGEASTHALTVADDSLVVGEMHYFQLLARNDVGDSELSDEASFAIAPLPAQPSSGPAIDQSESTVGSILVRWPAGTTIPGTPEEIPVTGYRLYMDGGNDGNYALIHDGAHLPGVLEYRVTAATHGLLAGRAYRLQVSALNYNGEGTLSAEALIYNCLSPSGFAAPLYVSSTESSLSVYWTAPQEVHSCPLYGYELFIDTGAGDAITNQVGGALEPHVTSYTIPLSASDASKTFGVQLVAHNDAGSVSSGIGSFLLADTPEAPDAPVNDAAVTNETRIKVNFAETLPAGRGSTILAVQLAMDDGAGGEFVLVVGQDEAKTTLATSYTAEDLVKGQTYRLKCRVLNAIGWSDWSTETYIVAAIAPAAPRAPTLLSATATEMSLRLYVPEDNGGSPLTEFELYINDGDDANEPGTKITTYTTNAETHTLSVAGDGLTTGLIYKLQSRAVNAIGNSERSETARFALVDPPSAPSAPALLTA